MYVRLKHALSALALRAIAAPRRSVHRAAVAWLAAFCHLAAGRSERGLPAERRFVVPLGDVAEAARRLGAGRGRRALEPLVEAGILQRRGDALALASGFEPHFPYMARQVHRAAGVISGLGARRRPRGIPPVVWKGAVLFNGGLFFECHEFLEDAWRAAPPEEKPFYHGIILVAAGFYHLEKGNLHGARTKLAAGINTLRAPPAASYGIRLDRWLPSLARWQARLDAGAGTGVLEVSEIPRIPFDRPGTRRRERPWATTCRGSSTSR
ncbi:MAG: DUF309 domain-containing protein [Armatimonadota bacterium]|nr:DUF309 domain-containing protein [Armatimonadota bacterium]MDR7519866.1 DUF309 domain-containing protein [Armatimonadota bacterium]MDR7551285.1 DUF309 domain-containing protein [Armatimonadota bacterium]